MTTDKTLADVQPGGKVRLATVPFDRAHDLLGDAYNAGTHGIGYSQQAMELHDAIIPAQPSPGGQGDAREMLRQFGEGGRLREGSRAVGHDGPDRDEWEDYIEVPVFVLDRIASALAARQPVGEPVAWKYQDKAADGVWEDRIGERLPCWEHRNAVPLYAGSPAQAVDLGEVRKCADEAVEFINHGYGGHARRKIQELLALIDKAVGNG
ncbi:TPA: hypothetical protein ACKPZV_000189 [Stenotrophomonas maltophilia]